MATDKSEPRVELIAKIAVLAVVTLVAVHAALSSYFDRMAQDEEYRKIGAAKPEALMSVRADEKQRLASGHMPIDQAMHEMAMHTRTGIGAELMPKPSNDVAPLQGWVKLPGVVPTPMMAASAEPSASAPGAAPSADGGVDAAPHAAPPTDAGARDAASPKRLHHVQ
jgi:hypothetical protein